MQNVEKSYCTFEWVEGLVKCLADSTVDARVNVICLFFFSFTSPTAVYEICFLGVAVIGNNLSVSIEKVSKVMDVDNLLVVFKNKLSICDGQKVCGITLSCHCGFSV